MPKLPVLKPREVVGILERLGSLKSLRKIIEDIRLTADEFLKLI